MTMDLSEGLGLLKRIARDELIHILEAASGAKDLVIEECLMKPLDRLAGLSLLKQHGTEKIFRLEGSKPLPWSEIAQHRVYFLRPTMINAKYVVDHVITEGASAEKRRFTVVFVPRKLLVCEMVLEQHGVFGEVAVEEFNPSFLALESDLLTLELPEFFPSYFLDGTTQWVHTVARSLWHLQTLFGAIPRVYGVGKAAEDVHKMTTNLFWELGEAKPTADQPFTHLFLLDRSLDLVTVFLSCLTYESLLDETFGINCGFTEFGPEVTKTEKGLKMQLSSSDEVFGAIRDRHFSHVFSYLSAQVKLLQTNYDKRHQMDKVSEMKDWVGGELKRLKQQHKSLQLHIGASEVVVGRKSRQGFEERLLAEQNMISGGVKEAISYIEDAMCQQLPEYPSLALLALLSLTQTGLSKAEFQSLRTQYLHAYGHKHLYTFHNLKKLGVFFERERSLVGQSFPKLSVAASPSHTAVAGSKLPPFQSVCKRLSLIPSSENINLKDPSDMSYVFNGSYTPALCQLVAQSLQFGFAKEELGRTFQAPILAEDSPLFPGGSGRPAEPRLDRAILVYFLGGVTYSELAALRLLARMRRYRIVVATTHIIDKQNFLKTLSEW